MNPTRGEAGLRFIYCKYFSCSPESSRDSSLLPFFRAPIELRGHIRAGFLFSVAANDVHTYGLCQSYSCRNVVYAKVMKSL